MKLKFITTPKKAKIVLEKGPGDIKCRTTSLKSKFMSENESKTFSAKAISGIYRQTFPIQT